jgi:hypothetical protein
MILFFARTSNASELADSIAARLRASKLGKHHHATTATLSPSVPGSTTEVQTTQTLPPSCTMLLADLTELYNDYHVDKVQLVGFYDSARHYEKEGKPSIANLFYYDMSRLYDDKLMPLVEQAKAAGVRDAINEKPNTHRTVLSVSRSD